MIIKLNIHDDRKVGQLGNKLFIIAAMCGYAKRNNTEFRISQWQYTQDFPNLSNHIIHRDEYLLSGYPSMYSEKQFNYTEIPYTADALMIDGYFQSEKYFSNCPSEVRRLFEPSDEVRKAAGDILNGVYGSITSIHIRRGDYINTAHSTFHGNLTMDYYFAAIDAVKSDKYVIFSDDIDWCKKQFIGDKFIFSSGKRNTHDLIAMSMCDNNIIANSSFSWWGAWLNTNAHKIVIAPDKWFGIDGPKKYEDIYTPNMIKIKC